MTITARHALVTGGSRGIGRGITLKLADHGVHVAINYLKDEASAKATLEQVRARGADGFTVQADISKPEHVDRLFDRVRRGVRQPRHLRRQRTHGDRQLLSPAMEIELEQWDAAMDSQAKAFLVGVRKAATMMPDGGRVIAITYAPGGRYGSWQSWVGMGAAKSALEVLCRYFAVALAPRGITVNALSPGWVDDSVLNTLPDAVVQMIREHHKAAGRRCAAWVRRPISGTPWLSSARRKPSGSRGRWWPRTAAWD